jgi:hypothetical protein
VWVKKNWAFSPSLIVKGQGQEQGLDEASTDEDQAMNASPTGTGRDRDTGTGTGTQGQGRGHRDRDRDRFGPSLPKARLQVCRAGRLGGWLRLASFTVRPLCNFEEIRRRRPANIGLFDPPKFWILVDFMASI